MTKHKAWKGAERKVAELAGGTRINGARGVQIEDVQHPIFSIEVKHGRTTIPKFVADAYDQAKRNAPAGKVPLVVLHPHGSREYMAVLPLIDLVRLVKAAGLYEAVAGEVQSEPVTMVTTDSS